MRRDTNSLTQRAFLALGLWAGFYLLAFGVAGGLLWFAWSVFSARAGHPAPLYILAAGSTIAALMILYSCLPRWSRFKAPGPKLDAQTQPELFALIHEVARAADQRPPDEVYLLLDVNAGVRDRGGFLGFFKKRVLTIGLPLLQVLTVSQLKSVLAHEFGHFAGGDTKLTPWVYKTHEVLERTLVALEGNDSIWRFPFRAYADLFLRLTLEVSRRQEYLADQLAVRIAGARASAEALKRTHRGGAAFPAYATEELFPLLDAGHRPPLAEGFARFMASPLASKALSRRMSQDLAARPDHRRDSHPPLALRLDAIRGVTAGPEPKDDPLAITLVKDLDGLEALVLSAATGVPRALAKIAWDDAAEKGLLPGWQESVKDSWKHLKGITPAGFPDLDLTAVGKRFDRQSTDAEARGVAMRILGTAFLVALRFRGWRLTAEPGERTAAVRGGLRVECAHVFLDLAEGKLTRAEWKERCEAGQFGEMDLGQAIVPLPEATAQSTG